MRGEFREGCRRWVLLKNVCCCSFRILKKMLLTQKNVPFSFSQDLRPEKFCGWYHSHPFDVTTHPHTFFSSTDLSTQLQWQRSEDSHGNPWLGCVIDPLRSMSTSELIMESFRAFPPEYTPVDKFSCPDGSVVKNESERLQRWGACFNRYYRLDTVYHMSTER